MTEPRQLRIALLTSTRERCGIAAYSRALAGALAEHVALHVVPVDRQPSTPESLERLNAADVIHIQHEYSFWGSALPGRSRFPALLAALRRPYLLTAHTIAPAAEVLGADPGAPGWRAAARRWATGLSALRGFIEVSPFEGAAG